MGGDGKGGCLATFHPINQSPHQPTSQSQSHSTSYVRKVGLVVIDEIHLLGADR